MAPSERSFLTLEPVDVTSEHARKAAIPLEAEGLAHGVLESNKLTYFVKQNKKPNGRAALALVVNIGSVVEEDHERGCAHICEHLAFNATKSFNNHDIVKFLETVGAPFGACQNAYTSADETVFELFIPIDKPGLLSKALSVLAEFSTEIRISDGDLKKERGVVLEEWRQHRDATGRMQEAYWALLTKGSRYAERLPIGTEKIIKTVPATTVQAFYRRWYRPEHMAVVAVGDFEDPQSVVQLIEEHFGGKSAFPPPPGESHPAIPRFDFTPHAELRVSTFADSESTSSAVLISCKLPEQRFDTIEEYQAYLAQEMAHLAINQRLFKISRQHDPPFYSCESGDQSIARTIESVTVSASCPEGGTLPALRAMLTELARIRLHGFSAREVATVRRLYLADMERAYVERDQTLSDSLRAEYVQHFLTGEPVPGIVYEARLAKTLLPQIQAADMQKVAQAYRTHNSCVIKTVEYRSRTSEAAVRGVVAEVEAAEAAQAIGPWDEGDRPDTLIRVPPTPGSVARRREYPVLGGTELTLSNGMRVFVKKTALRDDQILIGGFAYGGLSEVPPADYHSVSMAASITGELGVYGVKPVDMLELLAGTRAEVQQSVSAYQRGVAGEASPVDLETALQLIYQLFTTQVQPVQAELATVMHMTREAVKAQLRDPLTAYTNRVRSLNYGDSYFFNGWAPTDDRPGFSVMDSQKSASNTNDLRGKLLRITPNATNYTIPANNLFPADATHRPEIYAMGLRNPFRFAVDLLTNDVYWGEIGPDELASDPTRGPIGMDEINKVPYNDPGNYGWPYCLGPNMPYVKYDYSTQTSLNVPYNCSNPENDSPNNTGQKTGLPSSRAALAYYNYNNSTDFPEFDAEDPSLVLGRAAIAPFFYRYGLSCNTSAPYALPQFFDNTLFFFDWFRDTSRLLQFDSSGNLLKIAQSWPGFKFNSVMDMEMAPDGSLYIIEFGAGFALTGAQLSRMRYLGAPNPITCQVTASASTGVIPLAVQFSADASTSSDNLTLSYSWDFYSNGTVGSTTANPTFTYTKEGVAVATLTLKTSKASKTCTVPIDVQSNLNSPPVVSVDYPFEGGIYTWGDVGYFSVSVTDKEDGSTADGGVPCSNLQVTPGLGHCPGHLAPCHVHNSVANYACNGTFGPTEDEHSWEKFYYFLQALYPDRGGANGSAPITSLTFRQLKPSVWQSEFFDAVSSAANGTTQTTTDTIGGGVDVTGLSNGDWLRYDNFNLMNIDSVTFRGYSVSGAYIDLRIGSPTGRVIATVPMNASTAGTYSESTVPVQDTNQWFLVDMQSAWTVSRVQLDPGPWPTDFLRGFALYASLDNATWGTPFVPLAMGHAPVPTYINGSLSKNFTGLVDIPINPPVIARYLKIFNIGPAANTSWWSVAEFRAFDAKNASLGTANWTAQASTYEFDAPPKGALDGNLTTRWSTGESQRPGNVSLYTVFRSPSSAANVEVASSPAGNLLVLNYMTFNGQGLSSTPHDLGAKPPVSTQY